VPGAKLGYLGRVNIDAKDIVTINGEAGCRNSTDVAEADNCNPHRNNSLNRQHPGPLAPGDERL